MRSFFKMFFASFLALVVFMLLGFFLMFALVSALASKSEPDIPKKSVLVLDLGQVLHERMQTTPLAAISKEGDVPGLFDVIRLIKMAKDDDAVAGIYIEADENANGFASGNELRQALIDFKSSKKFVIAYGDMMSQGS